MTKISVIIPCYNVEKYVGECLAGILSQTIADVEIICVDDKSTDKTLKVIQDYSLKDKRVIVIAKEKNEGAGPTRNIGLKKATGEYVCFMDPDDYYPENSTLEKLYQAAVDNDVYISGGNIVGLNPDGSIQSDIGMVKFNQNKHLSYKDNPFCYGYTRFIYNRQFLIKNDLWFPDYLRFEDPPFFIKAMATAGKYYCIQDAVYVYRMSHKTITWTERKSEAVLKGINSALDICRLNGLNDLYLMLVQSIWCDYHVLIYKENAGSNKVDDALRNLFLSIDFNLLPPKWKAPYNKEYNKFITNDKILAAKFKQRLTGASLRHKFYYKYKSGEEKRDIYIFGVKILSYKKRKKTAANLNFGQQIFSITKSKDKKHKVITILGIKIKLKGE